MAEKRYLLTPGPTPVPPEVLAALAEPVIHHRARDYRDIYERCLARLAEVYRTQHDVLMFTTSGTGAFESAVANLTSPGDRQLVLSSGNFGERWAGMARAFGADLVHVQLAWGESPEPDDLRAALAEAGDVRVVYLTHSETSTGVVCDVQALAAVAEEAGALVVVDAVSSLGAVPLETDAWELDVVVSGSQKALMTPPGVAFVSVSPAALEAAARSTSPRYTLDWERTRKAQSKLDAAVHAGRLDRARARCCARIAARGRPRSSARPACTARAGLPRRREGHGPRAVLAGRGALRRRDGDPLAGRHRRD